METHAPAHVIRLRGPWEYCPLARTVMLADGSRRRETDDLPAAGRIIMPADWGATLGADFHGRVSYLRRFGRPTGLDAARPRGTGYRSRRCLRLRGAEWPGTGRNRRWRPGVAVRHYRSAPAEKRVGDRSRVAATDRGQPFARSSRTRRSARRSDRRSAAGNLRDLVQS